MRTGLLLVAALLSAPTAAQFKLDQAPSAQRAARVTAMRPTELPRLVPGRATPVNPINNPYAGSPYVTAATPLAPTVIGGPPPAQAPAFASAAKPADPAVDDPNRPRKALQPGSLARGVAPR